MKLEELVPDIQRVLNASLVVDACQIAQETGSVVSRRDMAMILIKNGMIDVYGEPTLRAINDGLVYKNVTYRKDTDE